MMDNTIIDYHIRRSRRTRRLRITITDCDTVVVTLPWRLPTQYAERFVQTNTLWIRRKTAELEKQRELQKQYTYPPYQQSKASTRAFVKNRIAYFNTFYRHAVGVITIRHQRTRWGSCSRRGNMNFNYKILFLPPELSDYIIVHELCHIRELNHSKSFWNLVAKTIPDCHARRKQLQSFLP